MDCLNWRNKNEKSIFRNTRSGYQGFVGGEMIIEWYSKDRCCWLKGKVTEEEFESIKKFHSVRIIGMDLLEVQK